MVNIDVSTFKYDINGNPVSNQPQTQTSETGQSSSAQNMFGNALDGQVGDNTSFSNTQSSNVYVVKAGDTLGKIAQMYNTTIDVLMSYNRDITNPNKIKVGQEIIVSGAEINATDRAITFIRGKRQAYRDAKANNTLEDYTKSEEARRALNKRGSAMSTILTLYNPDDLESAETLTDEQFDKTIEILKNEYNVHAGLTRQEAEKIGGKVLEDFNKICPEGHDVITEEDIILAKSKELSDSGISVASIFKTINSSEGMDRIKVYQKLIGVVADDNDVIDSFKDISSKEDLYKALGVNEEFLKIAEGNPRMMGKILGQHFKLQLQDAMNVDDENSAVVQEMRRLERGDFTEDEIAKGYTKGQGIKDPKKLFEMATQNIGKKYISTVAYLSQKAFAETDDNTKLAAIHGLFESLEDSPQARKLLQALGIESITNQDLKEQAAKDVYDNEKDDLGLDDISGFALTGTLLGNGSIDLIQQIFNENGDKLDTLKAIANGVIDSMPDGDKKDALKNILNNATNSANNSNSPSNKPSNIKDNITTDKTTQQQQQQPEQKTSTNPMDDRKRASQEWMEAHGITSTLSAAQLRAKKVEELEEIAYQEMRSKMRIKVNELKNMPLGLALSEMVEHYDQMPGKVKEKFKGQLIRMAAAHHDLACEAFIQGSDNLKKFLTEQRIITKQDVFALFDRKPAMVNTAPDNLRIDYNKYKSQELYG